MSSKRAEQRKKLAERRGRLKKLLGEKIAWRRKAQAVQREKLAERKKNRPPRERPRPRPRPRPPRRPRKKPGAKKEPREDEDRRRRWLGLALLLLLLATLVICGPFTCDDPPEEPVPEPEPAPVVAPEPVEVPFQAPDLDKVDRPAFEARPPDQVSWIESFRMQVAARSPRLARCFIGAEQPGQLKWTTSVEPASGLVSQHELVPMLTSIELNRRERACVLEVLEDPPYTLEVTGDDPSTPSRVGLVIEF